MKPFKMSIAQEVKICRDVLQATGKYYCRKCCQLKDQCDQDADMQDEQKISGICSNECWSKCTETELYLFKYMHPLDGVKRKIICIA